MGPGFDSLGLALGHYDTVRVTRIASGLEFDLTGEGTDGIPRTSEHLVLRAMQAAFDAAGAGALPPLRLEAHNVIPHGRGMGSSASAVEAGVLANGPQGAERAAEAVRAIAADAASPAHSHHGGRVSWRVLTLHVPREGAKVSVSTQ